jgi:hypothetical protein
MREGGGTSRSFLPRQYYWSGSCSGMNDKVVKKRLTSNEMAEVLSVKPRTLRKWRYDRIVPFEQVGFVILFDPEAVIAALKKYERKPAAVNGRKRVQEVAA